MSYQDYLNSHQWKKIAGIVKERAGYRCQVCNASDQLVAHHRTYDHLGDELNHLGDLICLCDSCHKGFHKPVRTSRGSFPTVMPDRPKPSCSPVKKPKPPCSTRVYINRKDLRLITTSQPAYDWYFKNDHDPRKKGWMDWLIGKWVPAYCIQEKYRADFIRSNGENAPHLRIAR